MAQTSSRWLGVVLTGASFATAGFARADVGGCEDVRIRVVGDVSPTWMDAIERACADLATVPSTDPSARVRISPLDGAVAVEVTLSDGRFASRRVASPAALAATMQALIVVPPQRSRAPGVAGDSSPAAPPNAPWPRAEDLEPVRSPHVPAAPELGVELGSGLAGRVAGRGYASLAFDALAEIRVGSWLFGTVFRWDFLGQKDAPLVTVFEFETVSAGLLIGRRTSLGFGSLDVGVAPRLAVETHTYENLKGETSLSATDVRLGAFARAAFGSSALRAFVALDAELSPSRLRRSVQLDPLLPALPSWTAGLGAGLLWAAP